MDFNMFVKTILLVLTLSNIVNVVVSHLINDYKNPNRCMSTIQLDGKTVIITGSNTGIGKATALDFYKRGAKVIMACRNKIKAEEAMDSIRNMITEEDKIQTESEVHRNTNGVFMPWKKLSKDGYELNMAVNHLGHFLFTLLLLKKIKQSEPARIINVTSVGHRFFIGKMHFNDMNRVRNPVDQLFWAYSRSKLANILFTQELAKRLKTTKVTVYAANTGIVKTEISRHVMFGFKQVFDFFAKHFGHTPEIGAQTILHCALDSDCANESGYYYSDCRITEPGAEAKNNENSKELWKKSCDLVKLTPEEDPFKSISDS